MSTGKIEVGYACTIGHVYHLSFHNAQISFGNSESKLTNCYS